MFTLKMSVSDHLSVVSSCQNSALNPSWARTCRCNKRQGDQRRKPRGRRGGARSRCGRWGCPPCPPPPPSVTLWRCLNCIKYGPVIDLKNDSVDFTIRLHIYIWASQEFSLKWVQFLWLMRRGHLCYSRPGEEREERRERKSTNIHRLRFRENCFTKLRLSTGMSYNALFSGKRYQIILVLILVNYFI